MRKRLLFLVLCTFLFVLGTVGQSTNDDVKIDCGPVRQKLIKMVRPIYPTEAKQARIEGTVALKCFIGLDGSVEKIEVEQGNDLLVAAAKNAVAQWKYKPLLLNGTPARTETEVKIIFQLPKESKKTATKQPSS